MFFFAVQYSLGDIKTWVIKMVQHKLDRLLTLCCCWGILWALWRHERWNIENEKNRNYSGLILKTTLLRWWNLFQQFAASSGMIIGSLFQESFDNKLKKNVTRLSIDIFFTHLTRLPPIHHAYNYSPGSIPMTFVVFSLSSIGLTLRNTSLLTRKMH